VKTNLLLKNPRKLSGRKLVATSSDYLFKEVKATAAKLKLSMNDLITACLSTGIKQYFKDKGDTSDV